MLKALALGLWLLGLLSLLDPSGKSIQCELSVSCDAIRPSFLWVETYVYNFTDYTDL